MKLKYMLAVFVSACLLLFGCMSPVTPEPQKAVYEEISMQEAIELMEAEKDYIILDVRTEAEFKEKHIPNAVNVPNENIGSEEIPELPDKDQLILVYCRSGNRSKKASAKLAELGYTQVKEFGGILNWTGEVVTE